MKYNKKYISIIAILALITMSISIYFIVNGNHNTRTEKTFVDKLKPEIKVIYDFAQDVNNKNYVNALDKLEDTLKGIYKYKENAPLRNIEHMEIIKLIDKTSEWPVEKYIKKFYAYRVYYAEVDYKINNIIFSYFTDGVFYHKIVTVKVSKDSPWQITEMSTSPVRIK